MDNLYHDTVPPTVKTDYNFYGGIYRDVWLRVTDPVVDRRGRLDDAVGERGAGRAAAFARAYQITARRRGDLAIVHEIARSRWPCGCVVFDSLERDGSEGSAESEPGPRILAAAAALVSRYAQPVHDSNHAARRRRVSLDAVETPLGFRWFRFDPQSGFFLNGKRVQIQGTNWHQSYPGMGNALPNSRHWKDMSLIREMGANFWRTSHYPHDPATMEASDRLGPDGLGRAAGQQGDSAIRTSTSPTCRRWRAR